VTGATSSHGVVSVVVRIVVVMVVWKIVVSVVVGKVVVSVSVVVGNVNVVGNVVDGSGCCGV
jgi:hypothetical protein